MRFTRNRKPVFLVKVQLKVDFHVTVEVLSLENRASL